MNILYKTTSISKLLSIAIILLLSTMHAYSQSFAISLGGQEISMLNTNRTVIVDPGNNGGLNVGSVHRYDNLITAGGLTVYGKLRIVSKTNCNIATFDDDTPGVGAAYRFQPKLSFINGGGTIKYELEFFELFTNANVYISDYFMTGVDIDGTEFYEVSGYSSYVVDQTCVLSIVPSTIATPGIRLAAVNNGELDGITFDNTRAFIAKFPHPATKITFVMGNTSNITGRQYSAQFGSLGGTFTTNVTNFNPATSLLINKTATPATFAPGNNGQYSINVTNANAAYTASEVTLTDILPAGLSYVSNSTSVFIPASTTTKIVRDEFTNAVYDAQYSSGIWSTPWQDDDLSPTLEPIYISGGRLTFSALDNGDQIIRSANLLPAGSTSGGATLSFDYQTTGLGSNSLSVQISPDGNTYTTLPGGTFSGTTALTTFTYTLTPAQITNNTRLKFTNTSDNWSSSGKAYIDNVQISYTYNKQDVLLTNGPGTLSNGVPPNLVTAGDAIALEPNVTMLVTFNVAVDCNASVSISNTATANCANLLAPVSASVTTLVGPAATATPICTPPGIATITATGAGSGQVYRWYDAASGGTLLFTGNPFVTPSIGSNTTYYLALYTAASNCESTRIPFVAEVNPSVSGTGVLNELTAKNGTPSGTKYADDQSSVGFSVTGINGATSYKWTINYPGATVVGPTNGSTIYYNLNNGGAQANVQVCVTPENSCGLGTPVCKTIGISDGVNRFISGYVFHDIGGSSGVAPNDKVDGVGISSIGGVQLYAVLVRSGLTVNTTPIASDGSYIFEYLNTGSGIYSVWITKTIHAEGTTPTASLPPGGVFNGEINNNSGNTATGNTSPTDGKVTGLTAGTETNVNFGIALTNPDAVDNSGTTNEDQSLIFDGLLSNPAKITTNDVPYSGRTINLATVDLDPNTSGIQNIYTVSGQGTFTVNNSGVVTFVPVLNFFGTVTANYTVNDNTGVTSDVATITVVVNPVNDVPSFSKGPDQAVCAGSGSQTVNAWATLLSAGPANESLQILSFTASNDNNSIFSVQPSVSSAGVLTFTPHATNSGTAIVSVRIQDDGGTANGGVDISAVQIYTITVNSNAFIALTSGFGSDAQTVCLNAAITNITYSVSGGGTGASITSGTLPSGVSSSYSAGVFTISGIPASSGTFNYTITTSGGSCEQASISGMLTVQSAVTAGTISGNQSICSGGDPIEFSGTVGTGSGIINYRWENTVSPFDIWTTIVGADQATYNVPSGLTVTTRYRRFTISNANSVLCESVATGEVEVTVTALPASAGIN
ncbi:MAG: cadherin-like domain-containing protein, partial [Prolixibacteraceae bacterium]|nr:cadherin-like domain-containing protein [Prolixibacteraceae bacterium]